MHFYIAYSLPQILYLFFTYAFLGWVSEVAFAAAKHGKYSNRGFLIGPICPIYGYGVVIVLLALTPLKKYKILLFICSVILTSTLEYLTGWYLEKRYNERWWDYSNDKFNLNGYICLEFSIIWGLACMAVIYLVNPPIVWVIDKLMSFKFGIIPGLVFLIVYIVDMIISDKRVKAYADKVKAIEVLDTAIRKVSDSMSYDIYENVMDSKEKIGDFMEKEEVADALKDIKEHRAEIEARRAEIDQRIAEAEEERKTVREERRAEFEERRAELEKRRVINEAERKEEFEKYTAELEKELEIRRQKRAELMADGEKHFKRIISKFPSIASGKHKDIFMH